MFVRGAGRENLPKLPKRSVTPFSGEELDGEGGGVVEGEVGEGLADDGREFEPMSGEAGGNNDGGVRKAVDQKVPVGAH